MKRRGILPIAVLLVVLAFAARLRHAASVSSPTKQMRKPPASENQSDTTWHALRERTNAAPFPERHASSSQAAANQAAAQSRQRDAIPGEYVLRFYDSRDQLAFLRAAQEAGMAVLGQMPFGNAVHVRVGDRAELDALLQKTPPPTDISENYRVRTPPDAEQGPQQPEGRYVGFGDAALEWLGVAAGQNDRWGLGATVAVLDTGVIAHPALAEARVTRVDLLGGCERELPNPHATAVASLIAGSASSVDGIAPGAAILSIRVMSDEGVGNTFLLAQGIVEAADRGAKVINLCVGTYGNSPLLRDAVGYATGRGSVVVAAVGNDGIAGVVYPAAYDSVVAVSAVDASGRHLYFANRGAQVDLAAPGIGIAAASTNGLTQLFSGTSAAVPFVSGALAALLSQDAHLSGSEAVGILTGLADDQGAPGRDDVYGWGLLNMRRVMQRDQRRLYDAAAADATVLEDPSGDLFVTFTGQNRGTEDLSGVTMEIWGGGRRQSVSFSGVGVGQTVSHTLRITRNEVQQEGGLEMLWSLEIRGAADVRPQDNVRRLTLSSGRP